MGFTNGSDMPGTRKEKAADIVFEGVVIPKGTCSAKLAAKGINSVEEMSDFLTAIFSDTLKGKIKLPSPETNRRVSSAKTRDGLEEKLRQGLPMTIKGAESSKTRSSRKASKRSKKSGPSDALPGR